MILLYDKLKPLLIEKSYMANFNLVKCRQFFKFLGNVHFGSVSPKEQKGTF